MTQVKDSTIINGSWIKVNLRKISRAADPRKALAEWFNSRKPSRKVAILLFVGMEDCDKNKNHVMDPSGKDQLFEQLAKTLGITEK